MKLGTCGYARTAMQVSIQDDNGRELSAGETGEICVCGPAVFAGYYNNPEANSKAFRNGWFRTGDLGHIDSEDFLYITGRASDMYISGGSNVYPRETEEKMLMHPEIAEVAILGVPDKTWGEVGVAVCVLRPDAQLDEKQLLAWMEGKVARYKLPKRVFFGTHSRNPATARSPRRSSARSLTLAVACRSTNQPRPARTAARRRDDGRGGQLRTSDGGSDVRAGSRARNRRSLRNRACHRPGTRGGRVARGGRRPCPAEP